MSYYFLFSTVYIYNRKLWSSICAVTISINFTSLLVARKKFDLPEGAFRAPGGNVLPVVALALIIICYIPDIINGGWMIWAYSIAWYVCGIIYYKIRQKNAK